MSEQEPRKMNPLFVSYAGRKNDAECEGCIVLEHYPPVASSADVSALIELIETNRQYDPQTVVLVNFRRLEDPASGESTGWVPRDQNKL
ncbi:putative phosphohydrolase [Bradyrhizobium sp. USDA 4341]